MAGRRYPSDLTDVEWAHLAPLLPPPRPPGSRGRPRAVPVREVVNAILYVLRTGCQWRALPTDLPNWRTVYWYHDGARRVFGLDGRTLWLAGGDRAAHRC